MKKILLIPITACLLMWPLFAFGQPLSTDDIMDRLEARYDVRGVSVWFFQTSTIKALDISDSAMGRIFIKQPGRMRWEYESPERQAIITDGETFWVYRPEDNQVTTGKASAFFGEGKGGVLLSDMAGIREYFSVELVSEEAAETYVLKLIPREPEGDLQAVFLTISKDTFEVKQASTLNPYGDETRYTFESPQFDIDLDEELFSFSPTEGMEVLTLAE